VQAILSQIYELQNSKGKEFSEGCEFNQLSTKKSLDYRTPHEVSFWQKNLLHFRFELTFFKLLHLFTYMSVESLLQVQT